MQLSDLQVNISYITYGPDNIRDALIVPALKLAVSYKRSVGYFSTSVFDTILDGVVELVKNGGTIQIIASPKLNQDDVDAIQLGYEAREHRFKSAFLRDFDSALEKLSDAKLQLAAQLIAQGILDIQIVDLDDEEPTVSSEGEYHDKLGIITDTQGNSIVFVGSPNETINGYKKNYEKVRVFTSWVPALNAYVEDEIHEFDALWFNENPFTKTYKFESALRDHVLEIQSKRSGSLSSRTNIELTDYQKAAIKAWIENDYHGFYVMATGTGKTWTAIYSIVALLQAHECLTVICAPYKHLVRQWVEDVEKAFPTAIIIMVSSENSDWDKELTRAIIQQRYDEKTKIIVISTIRSFNGERFENTIRKSKQEKLLIVDEAHRFTTRPDFLSDEYQYMLGLSATPFNGKNAQSGLELMNFFGGQVYNLSIEDAINNNYLVPYYYYPIYVHATYDEEQKFKAKTSQIMGCFDNKGVCIDPDNLAKYLRARVRIIAMAQEKMDYIVDIINQVKEKDHFIVYCGDGWLYNEDNDEIRHINFVKRKLDSLGYKASQFTATENMETRMNLVDMFNRGEIDAIAAIRCLDEGINIPSIKSALILASNDNYREFVQRRGRILRKYEGKKFACIYDVIVLPSVETPKMAEIEFRRFYEYARLAINAEEKLQELTDVASDYGINIDDLTIDYDDEFKEGPIDE